MCKYNPPNREAYLRQFAKTKNIHIDAHIYIYIFPLDLNKNPLVWRTESLTMQHDFKKYLMQVVMLRMFACLLQL